MPDPWEEPIGDFLKRKARTPYVTFQEIYELLDIPAVRQVPDNAKRIKEIATKCGQLTLPPTVSGKTLGAVLRRLPYWQELIKEYEARGEWLRPYSFRDTFSVRAHSFNISDTNIAQAMGHTVEVHHRSYRTTEWKAVRSAFAQAS